MISSTELAAALGLPAPTGEQVAVIEAPLAPGLVVAGAGSGKTETMAARVVYLVATGQVKAEQIIGLTFTKKAAAALGQRVRRRLRMLGTAQLAGQPIAGVGDPEVATYHAFGGRLIADFGPLAGVEPASRVLTPTGAWQLARHVVGRWDGDLRTDLGPDQVTERLLAISGALADHLTDAGALADVLADLLERLRSAPPSPRQRGPLHSALADHVKRLQDRQWILPLVQAFAEAKRERGVIDFADQMQIAATLVRAHPRIGATLRERYRVVLLDEYQDTGHAQREILRTLFGSGSEAAAGHPVTAVGDPVQSIYSWRGASAANLPRFGTDFPQSDGSPAPTRPLLTSFRNPAGVLGLANGVSAAIRTGPAAPVEVDELRPVAGAPAGDIRFGLFPTVVDEDAWLARSIAERWRAATNGPDPQAPRALAAGAVGAAGAAGARTPPTTAVLLRRRSDMPATAEALRAAGLPVEVVGLGGLLDEPEIADLVATLRILTDPTAGAAAVRLLTGARWQLGAADLEALAQRARMLAVRPTADVPTGEPGKSAVRAAVAQALSGEDIDTWCLVDAIFDPGPASQYSTAGHRRLVQFAGYLRRLRSRLGQPLSDLMSDLERASGLDIEVQLSSPAGRAHLDAFANVVAEVAATGAGPAELLSYLDAAAEREDGLAPGEVPATSGRVQVLTVHAAKGLEWEIVAVPHLTEGVFPITRGSTWLGDAAQLPPELRGDRDELPGLSWPADGNQKDVVDALAEHSAAFAQLRLSEERRLLYVALTRAERVLLFSGHHWGSSTAKPAGPSEFLLECVGIAAQAGEPDEWAPAPDPTESNPLTRSPRTASWPVDPLGSRRPAVAKGADRVLRALSSLQSDPIASERAVAWDPAQSGTAGWDLAGSGTAGWDPAESGSANEDAGDPVGRCADDPPGRVNDGAPGRAADDAAGWAADVSILLAERAAAVQGTVEVDLPATLSVSALVELAADPQRLASRLRRPVPLEPAPQLRRGTSFHQWLERFFRGEALLDIRDLPGAGDGWLAGDPEFDELRRQFLSSTWANRVPVEIEVPFATRIAGIGIRGRIDAVFADHDGGLTVVDWKTGRPPATARRAALGVQLACYRIAMAELSGLPLDLVRAAFHYIPTGTTVAPVDLLEADGIGELVASATDGQLGDLASSPR
ncbi:MAG: ATP-dependent DNA helicase [Nakamurella sp.]